MRHLATLVIASLFLGNSAYQPVAKGQVENLSGYVAATFNKSTNLIVVTVSDAQSDGPVRVGYLMQIPVGAKIPDIHEVFDVYYRGHEYLQLSVKGDVKLLFTADTAAKATAKAQVVRVEGFQRLGLKPGAFENHQAAAAPILERFKTLPKPPSRDAKRP